MKSQNQIIYISAVISLLAVSACKKRADIPRPPKTTLLPSFYGVYALDRGELTRLEKMGRPPGDDQHRQQLSGEVSIIIFQKWLSDPNVDLNSFWFCDWSKMDEEPRPEIHGFVKPVENHSDMLILVPPSRLKPGLYGLELGKDEYPFAVDTTDVAAFWRKVLDDRPNSWQAHNHLGAELFIKRQFDEALKHFSEAVRLKPDSLENHNNLGLAYVIEKHLDEGIAQYREALRIKGDEPSIRINLANALVAAKRYDEAIAEYQEAIKLDPNNAAAHGFLGYTLVQVQRLSEGISEFERALKLDPQNKTAIQNLEAVRRLQQTNGK